VTNIIKMSQNVKDMETNRCILIKNMLSKDLCEYLSAQAEIDELKIKTGHSKQVPGSVEIYDSIATKITNNIVLYKLKETLKLKNIYATYGFYRKYYEYQELTKHTDRPECELSVSICLNMFDEKEPWEIFFENKEQDTVYEAKPDVGDAVVYMGMELPHWREACRQKWLKQLFLHYTFNKQLEFDLTNAREGENTQLEKAFIKLLIEQN
jgi:hypothetical protein